MNSKEIAEMTGLKQNQIKAAMKGLNHKPNDRGRFSSDAIEEVIETLGLDPADYIAEEFTQNSLDALAILMAK